MVDNIAIKENDGYTTEIGYQIHLTKGYITEVSFVLSFDELVILRDLLNEEIDKFIPDE